MTMTALSRRQELKSSLVGIPQTLGKDRAEKGFLVEEVVIHRHKVCSGGWGDLAERNSIASVLCKHLGSND